ncbi:MAG: head GIN domain-containing protein [Chitinophagaceae bacterium]
MKRFFVVIFFIPVVLMSCHFMNDRIRGNGTIVTETRKTGNFTSVDVGGSIDVYLKQDSVSSVKIETDENLMEYIIIRTDGNKLVIEPEDHHNLSGTKGVKVYVSSALFERLEASGASSFNSQGILAPSTIINIELTGASNAILELNTPEINADMTGASSIRLKGQTKNLTIEGTGASHAKCFDLMTENARVALTGASSAEVFASVSIRASASGASHVRYKGNASVNQSKSGAGSVDKAD